MRRFLKGNLGLVMLIVMELLLVGVLIAACGSDSKPGDSSGSSGQVSDEQKIGVVNGNTIAEFSTPDARCVMNQGTGALSCWPLSSTPSTTVQVP